MCPVPCKIRILALSSRKCKLRPCTDSFTVSNHLIATVFIELLRRNFFYFISTYPVIKHYIRINIYIFFMKRFDSIQVLILGSVLGCNRTLLLKFTKIIQIIHTVSYIFCSICPLISRRKPYSCYSCGFKLCSILL